MILTSKTFNDGSYVDWNNYAPIGSGAKLNPGFFFFSVISIPVKTGNALA